MDLSIVIPCYNEFDIVGDSVRKIDNLLVDKNNQSIILLNISLFHLENEILQEPFLRL